MRIKVHERDRQLSKISKFVKVKNGNSNYLDENLFLLLT